MTYQSSTIDGKVWLSLGAACRRLRLATSAETTISPRDASADSTAGALGKASPRRKQADAAQHEEPAEHVNQSDVLVENQPASERDTDKARADEDRIDGRHRVLAESQ